MVSVSPVARTPSSVTCCFGAECLVSPVPVNVLGTFPGDGLCGVSSFFLQLHSYGASEGTPLPPFPPGLAGGWVAALGHRRGGERSW